MISRGITGITKAIRPAKPKIFISYRREDAEAETGRIFDRLVAHFGNENVFMDIDTIPFGVDFRKHIVHEVSKCDVILAVIGKHWLDVKHGEGPKQGQRRLDDPADFVRIEIQTGLDRNIPVVPLLVGGASIPSEQQLPKELQELSYRNAAEVRSGRDFHGHMDVLIRGLDQLFKVETHDRADMDNPDTGQELHIELAGFWDSMPDSQAIDEFGDGTLGPNVQRQRTPAKVNITRGEIYRFCADFSLNKNEFRVMWKLASVPQVRSLSLYNCKYLSDDELSSLLQKFNRLEGLVLVGTNTTDKVMATLGQLKTLKYLDIRRCGISEAALIQFRRDVPTCSWVRWRKRRGANETGGITEEDSE